MGTMHELGLSVVAAEFKMELSVGQLLHSILIMSNSSHEIWASFKSTGLLPLT